MTQKQHIQLRLMIAHKHRGPRLIQPVTSIFLSNIKPHAGEKEHDPFEASRRSPLP